MKFLIAIAVVLSGCTYVSETQNPDTLPQLVYRTALPTVPPSWSNAPPKMEVLLQVSRTGEVTQGSFIDHTGNDAWEARALEEMKHWRFSPARLGQDSVQVWVRLPIAVRFTDPMIMYLEQLVCADRACADSARLLLEEGHEFESLARELPAAGCTAYEKNIGEMDIRTYPKEVQKELLNLKEDGFTVPIQIGGSFVIFKRLERKQDSGV